MGFPLFSFWCVGEEGAALMGEDILHNFSISYVKAYAGYLFANVSHFVLPSNKLLLINHNTFCL